MIASAVVIGVLGLASYLDARTGYIRNWLTVPLFLAGLAYSLYVSGLFGLGQALLCSLLAVPMAYPYALLPGGAKPGGGDIKLVMAVGAWLKLSDLVLFFACVQASRFLLEMIVRLAARRGKISEVVSDLKYETRTLYRSFCVPGKEPFARAAANVGYSGHLVVPGALIIFLGVVFLEILKRVVGF